jgi:hypothetical protein
MFLSPFKLLDAFGAFCAGGVFHSTDIFVVIFTMERLNMLEKTVTAMLLLQQPIITLPVLGVFTPESAINSTENSSSRPQSTLPAVLSLTDHYICL